MMRRLLALLALAALTACAINPATGRRELALVSESEEVSLGRSNDREVQAQMGLYDDDALAQYVNGIGQSLASRSERPRLAWTFRVVDDPVVNAFALPGGYIYITRGILAHLDSEAELASVVGHEIGHVTARHSVNQMSKAQLAQLGLGLGSVLAPERAAQLGELLQTGLGLVFLKFSRDDERQADDLGLRYLVRSGYDPRPMANVFDMLGRVSAAQGGERVPGWMSTHPAPENRRQRIEQEIAQMKQDFGGRPVDRESYLARLEGIAFGDDPRQGFFRESTFLHPSLDFQIEFPAGWKLQNLRQTVVGKSPEGDALIALGLAQEATADAALEKFFSSHSGVTRTAPRMDSIHGLPTAGAGLKATVAQGTLVGRVGYVQHGGHVFELLGYAAEARWPALERTIREALVSFDRLGDPRARTVEPSRLHIVRPAAAMTLEELASRYHATVPLQTLALINRLDPGARVEAGGAYKVITGGPEATR